MSDLIFPTLRGLTYPIGKTPNWSTITQRSITGIPKFFQQYAYPYYTLKLQFEYLSDDNDQEDDIHMLMGFYNRNGGAGQDFLFADDLFENSFANNQLFGVGDGITTQFRLTRNYGGFIEPIFGIVNAPAVITANGVPTSAFTWNTHGLITFSTAPAVGTQLKWSGNWYYRCHFKNDTSEFQNIFNGIWDLQELDLETIKI